MAYSTITQTPSATSFATITESSSVGFHVCLSGDTTHSGKFVSPIAMPVEGDPPNSDIVFKDSLHAVDTLLRFKYSYQHPKQNLTNSGKTSLAKSDTDLKSDLDLYAPHSVQPKNVIRKPSLSNRRCPELLTSLPKALSSSICNVTKLREHQNTTRGRPFTASLNARFYLHASLEEMLCHLNRVKSFKYTTNNPSLEKTELQFVSAYQNHSNTESITQCKNIVFNLPSMTDLQPKLCHAFSVDRFQFVRVIRNIHGRTIKLETVTANTDQLCNAEWVKQTVCYPRYKAQMKIHLIRCNPVTSKFSTNMKDVPVSQALYVDDMMLSIDHSYRIVSECREIKVIAYNQ